MKKIIYGLLLLGILSCGKDDDGNNNDNNVLRYDGENASSPIFPAGSHEAAARFPNFVLDQYEGKALSSVEIFVYDVPRSFTFNVYTSGSAAGPDILLQSDEVSSQMQANGINAITYDPPIPLDGEIWLSASWTQTSEQQVIGCDAGPANANGDWLFLSTENDGWSTFRGITGESVNWNIRGILTDL